MATIKDLLSAMISKINKAPKTVNGVEPDENGNIEVASSWNDLPDKPFGEVKTQLIFEVSHGPISENDGKPTYTLFTADQKFKKTDTLIFEIRDDVFEVNSYFYDGYYNFQIWGTYDVYDQPVENPYPFAFYAGADDYCWDENGYHMSNYTLSFGYREEVYPGLDFNTEVKIYRKDTKSINTKYLPEHLQFGETVEQKTIYNTPGEEFPLDGLGAFNIGDIVTITVDGAEYSLVAYDDEGYVTIGDPYAALEDGTGELGWQVFVADNSENAYFISYSKHTMATTTETVIKTIDPKYVPVVSSVFDKLVDAQLIKSLSLNEADTGNLEWGTLSFPSAIMGYDCELSNFYAAFAGEEKLLIVFNGVAYITKRTLEPVGSTVFYIGNTKFFGGPDTGEPFCIACNWYFQPHAHIVMSSYEPFSIDVYRIRDDLKKEVGFTENLIRVIRADYPGQESTDIYLTRALNIDKPHIIEVRGDQLIIENPSIQGNAYIWGSVETDGFALYNNVHYPDYQIDPNGYSWGGVYMKFDLEKYPDIDPVNDVLIYELDYDVVFLTSPNGTTYKLTVSDDGTLSATAV